MIHYKHITPQFRVALGVVCGDDSVRVVRFYFNKETDINRWAEKLKKKISKGKIDPYHLEDKYFSSGKLKSPNKMLPFGEAATVFKKHPNHFFNSERKHNSPCVMFLFQDGELLRAHSDSKKPEFELI